MRKQFLKIIALGGLLFTSIFLHHTKNTSISANETGIYIRGGAGIVVNRFPTDINEFGKTIADITLKSDPSAFGELGIGYDFGQVRLEAEMSFDRAEISNFGNVAVQNRPLEFRYVDAGAALFIELDLFDTILPFIGFGIGGSHVIENDFFKSTSNHFYATPRIGLGIAITDDIVVDITAAIRLVFDTEFAGHGLQFADGFQMKNRVNLGIRYIF